VFGPSLTRSWARWIQFTHPVSFGYILKLPFRPLLQQTSRFVRVRQSTALYGVPWDVSGNGLVRGTTSTFVWSDCENTNTQRRVADCEKTGGKKRPHKVKKESMCVSYNKPTRCTNFSNLFWEWNMYWTEELPETCRVSFQMYICEIGASSWFIIRNLSRCAVTWTSNPCAFIQEVTAARSWASFILLSVIHLNITVSFLSQSSKRGFSPRGRCWKLTTHVYCRGEEFVEL
jgi:hypothetical protein